MRNTVLVVVYPIHSTTDKLPWFARCPQHPRNRSTPFGADLIALQRIRSTLRWTGVFKLSMLLMIFRSSRMAQRVAMPRRCIQRVLAKAAECVLTSCLPSLALESNSSRGRLIVYASLRELRCPIILRRVKHREYLRDIVLGNGAGHGFEFTSAGTAGHEKLSGAEDTI